MNNKRKTISLLSGLLITRINYQIYLNMKNIEINDKNYKDLVPWLLTI